jgi:hypothetical protein
VSAVPPLADLPLCPYLTEAGLIDPQWQGRIAVYAIFDESSSLRYVGYSRNLGASLLQHLLRQPGACQGLKVHCVERPRREDLEWIAQTWREENPLLEEDGSWTQPLDVRPHLSEAESLELVQAEDSQQAKLLKTAARRLEEDCLAALRARGFRGDLRFNPKLKEQGLLDLKI